MDRWFVEEAGFDGQWKPMIYNGDMPTEKRLGGQHRRFRKPPTKMNVGHKNLTVMQAANVYGVDAKLKA